MSNEIIANFPTWYIITENVTEGILFLATIISLPLYLLEIFLIYRSRSNVFRGPFYRILLTGMIIDIFSAINIFLGQIIPAKNWFSFLYTDDQNGNYLGKVFYTITYGGRCIQGATAMLLAFNRVSAVCFPLFYRKMTNSFWSIIMNFIQTSGGFASLILIFPKSYTYYSENDGFYAAFNDQNFRKWFYIFVSLLEVLFVISIVFFNIATLASFHFSIKLSGSSNSLNRRNSQVNQRISSEKQRVEQSMTRMSFIVCTVEVIYFVFIVYTLLLHSNMNKRYFYYFYNILCIFYSTFSAWMLILFSPPIKLQIMRIVKWKTTSMNEAIRITTIELQKSNNSVFQ
ncbi:unnamed protein product [Caenorhabditis angaria]|uniref:Serpentine receptor class gamma n=1 Tax=Caenorhabditis angaria TaxID=860376 RepID=A0A9P1IV48_9PELO|nr:unnamed protein product [Caenorhabditis angaria]